MTRFKATRLAAMLGAAALLAMPGSATAGGLIGSTIDVGFYFSEDLFGPDGDPTVLYPDQVESNVLVEHGKTLLFSTASITTGPYASVTFTKAGITFVNLVGDPFLTSVFGGFIFDILSGPDIASAEITERSPEPNFSPFVTADSTPRQIRVNFSGSCPATDPLDPSTFTCIGAVNGVSDEFLTVAVETVPEPASLTLMAGGLGIVGGAMRRRRREEATVGVA